MNRIITFLLLTLLSTGVFACGGDSSTRYIEYALSIVVIVAAFGAVTLPSCILTLHNLISVKKSISIILSVTLVCAISFILIMKNPSKTATATALFAMGVSLFLPYVLLLFKTVKHASK